MSVGSFQNFRTMNSGESHQKNYLRIACFTWICANWPFYSKLECKLNTKSMYNSFKQWLARRADFSTINPESKVPKNICQIWWIENADVCNGTVEFYNNVKDCLTKTKKLPDTIETLKTAIQVPLIVSKIMFFFFSGILSWPIYTKMSIPQSMMPFVYGELVQVSHSLYSGFINQEVTEEANTTSSYLNWTQRIQKSGLIPGRSILVLTPTNILKRSQSERNYRETENLSRKIALSFCQLWCLG